MFGEDVFETVMIPKDFQLPSEDLRMKGDCFLLLKTAVFSTGILDHPQIHDSLNKRYITP